MNDLLPASQVAGLLLVRTLPRRSSRDHRGEEVGLPSILQRPSSSYGAPSPTLHAPPAPKSLVQGPYSSCSYEQTHPFSYYSYNKNNKQ